jgi:hypothetical protein
MWSYCVPATYATGSLTSTKETAPGRRPGAADCLVRISYFFSSPIAALALSTASDELPALHAASASLTRVEALLNSAERGAWSSWLRGAWSSWLRGAWSS